MGSVHYFSPEQASGQAADVTSDIYSVGVVLYEMLTGRVPFDGDSPVAIAMQHLHARPAPIESIAPDVPPAISHVCMMAMEKNPKYRYQSAKEMAAELRMALEGRTDQMQPRLVESVPGPAALPQRAAPAGKQASGAVAVAEGGSSRHHTDRRRTRGGRLRASALWWIVTALVAGFVFYGLYLGGMGIYEKVVNSATVPDMVGMDKVTAQRAATRVGLKSEVVEINHPTISAGTVILQAPEVDTSLRKGDTVVLTVSKGPAALSVPAITGMTTQAALPVLQTTGLTLAVVEKVVSTDVPADVIITQTPEAGESCQSGEVVQVTVSGGAAYVPNLSGKTLGESQELLQSAGLTLNATLQYQDTSDASLHGTVAMQTPASGAQVILSTSVSLTVYRVAGMTHSAKVTLDLPESDGLLSVRVTLNEGGGEYNAYQADYAVNTTRHPEIELTAQTAGVCTYKVYINEKFAYQQQLTLE